MDNSVIAKSGWLFRQAGKEWIKNWVELYRDGYLKYYESDYSPNAEDLIFMPTDCLAIKSGSQVDANIRPPEEHSAQCLFSVSSSGNKTWVFCGESIDNMRSWQLALEQARLLVIRSNYLSSPYSSSSHPLIIPQSLSHPLPNFNVENSLSSEARLNSLPPHSSYPSINSNLPYFHNFNSSPLSYLNSGHRSLPYPDFSSSNVYFDTVSPQSINYHFSFGPPSHDLLSSPSHQLPLPSSFTSSYLRSDGRDLSSNIMAGSGVNSMLWTPYIWW